MATITGTANDDSITPAGVSPGVTGGVPSDAADSILGGSGADTLDGGNGNDFVKGQNGDDTLIGNDGDDHLGAGRGDDTVEGGAGNDRLRGHTGDDVLRGGAGNDWLEGDAPLSSANYVAGNDLLRGGGGDDRLIGFGGADRYFGGGGDDRLIGFGGADRYFGGDGDDILVLHDLDFASIDGGSGGDKLKVAAAGLDLDFTGALGDTITGIETLDLSGGDHTVTLDAASVSARGSETGKLKILGRRTDTVALSDDFSLTGQQVRGTTTFDVYTADGTTVWIDTFVRVTIGGRPAKPGVIDLADLNGANGFVLNGIEPGDRSGGSVSGAGDVNGDGYDDVIIGAYVADPNGKDRAGESYVVFGKAGGFDAALELSDLDGSNGFVIKGSDRADLSGRSVSGAGDVNGDGFDDVIIGAPWADPNRMSLAGESYVVFGKAGGFRAAVNLRRLDEANGFVINGVDSGDVSGHRVGGAGDVNGDGYADVIIGAIAADPNGKYEAGESYVVFGKAGGFDAAVELSTLDGSDGFVLNGIDERDQSGRSVSGAGDINGDGYDDVIIGAKVADPNGKVNAGESYVVFGKAGGFDPALELSALDGTSGFVINGIDELDFSGYSVSGAGDVNGDGYDDLIIGAIQGIPGTTETGESYVVFGKAGGFDAILELSTLDGANGFVINGIDADDKSGRSVGGAGDVNGDGYDDLIIGAYRADPKGQNGAGESYVVFGRAGGFEAAFDLSALDGSNGFVFEGIDEGDQSGRSVSGAGDVNGDGFDDLIIGARYADPNGREDAGESYVVFGGADIGAAGAVAADLGTGLTGDDPLLL